MEGVVPNMAGVVKSLTVIVSEVEVGVLVMLPHSGTDFSGAKRDWRALDWRVVRS
jgi:hypothetical protein